MIFSEHIQEIESKLADFIQHQPVHSLYDPIKYFFTFKGKRIRPLLVLLSTEEFGGNIEEAFNTALAIEVFHNFSLIHDDIMDEAPLRRGNVTVHEKWDNSTAILSGDATLILAYQLLNKAETRYIKPLLEEFNQMALWVCEGQQSDMDLADKESVHVQEYIEMITKKTAVLVGTSLKMGAIHAGMDEVTQHKIYEFGKKLGIAFQLQDDILDIFSENTGKQKGGDILENKKTLPILLAISRISDDKRCEFIQLLNSNDSQKVEKVTEILIDLEVEGECQKYVEMYSNQCLDELNSINVLPSKEKFTLFHDELMRRTY